MVRIASRNLTFAVALDRTGTDIANQHNRNTINGDMAGAAADDFAAVGGRVA
jgi:hypothetical protein